MLKTTINTATELQREFISYDRDYYTLEGYEEIINYFNDFDVELDVIAICGDFNEESIDDIISNYLIEINKEDNKFEEVMDYLNNNTYAVETVDNNILYITF